MRRFRKISSWILLITFSFVMVLCENHHHKIMPISSICTECAQNNPNPQHIHIAADNNAVCLACIWLQNIYNAAKTFTILAILALICTVYCFVELKKRHYKVEKLNNKAPPFTL